MARAMKDSGIEWIGDIPANWTVRRLRYMCNIVTGNQDTQDNDPSGRYPFYVRSPIVEKSNKYTFEGPAILMSGDGAGAGRIFHMVDGKYGCHQRVYSIQDISGIDRRVLYHYMSNLFWIMIETANSKSTVDSVRLNMLQDFPVLIPPEEEQEKISRCLSDTIARIDNIISKTRASVEEYKKLKQAVITQAVTKGIRSNRKMKDSGIKWIGEIPSEWKIIKIKWILNERKEKSENGEAEPLSMSQKYGIIPTREMASIPNMASSFIGAKTVYSGDLVFNKLKAHLGVFAVSQYNGIVSPDYAVYCSKGIVNVKYLEYLFKTPQYIAEFRKKSSGVGAGLTRLYTDGLYSIYCLLPSQDEQEEIISYLNKKIKVIDTLIEKKDQYLSEIENYKKSLIYEYVTGKKEVPCEPIN